MRNNEHRDAVIALSQFRATIYLLLSRTFREELDRDALMGLEEIRDALAELSDLSDLSIDKNMQTGQTLLKTFFEGIRSEETSGSVEDLARDYATLFLGVGSKTVSLCESVYMSGSGMLYQPAHFEVRQAYQKMGMTKSDDFIEPDDHLAVELSYMAQLGQLTRDAINEGGEKSGHYLGLQKDFLRAHLLAWIPDFSKDLIETTRSPFYRAMGFLLNGYIQVDKQLIDLTIQELNVQEEIQAERG